jgi:outer membrane usher protein
VRHAKSKALDQADATRAEPMTGLGVSNRSSSDARKIPRVNQLNSPREPRRLSHAKFPGRNENMASHVQVMLPGGGEFCDKAQDAVGVLTGCSAQLTSYFAPKVYDVRPSAQTLPEVRSGYGAVLNYNLFAASNAFGPDGFGLNGVSASFDGRAFSPFGVFAQSFILRSSGTTLVDRAASSQPLRLDTSFTYSDPQRLVAYRLGDAITGGLSWTRPIRIGGAQIQRNFALRPDLVTMPLAGTSGSAAVPSVADVYIGNVKAYSQNVDAGPYQITNIPVVAGGGEARVVLTDAAGHQIQTSLPFYASPSLLAPGLMNFSVEAGLSRTGFGTDTDANLGKEVGSATLRKGIHDWLTVEAHAEAGAGTANAGVGAVVRTGGFGLASLAIAGSRTGPAHGFQPYASFETRVGVLTFSASSQASFGKYDDLAAATGRIQNSGFFYRTRKWDVLQLVIPTWGASAYSFSTYAPPKTLNRLSLGTPLPLNLGSVS